ncbi:NUDIX hydrolase [Pseudomonadota bacterium]
MHRQFLTQKLAQYSPHTANEKKMQDDIIHFVNEHTDCFERSLKVGHITGSAWIVDKDRTHALMTHHRKLNRWLQLGGHSDGDSNTLNVALREGLEESGLTDLHPVSEDIFDVDVHLIPTRKEEPDHYHYDVRFLLEADRNAQLVISNESHDLAWLSLDAITQTAPDESIQRMVDKTIAMQR